MYTSKFRINGSLGGASCVSDRGCTKTRTRCGGRGWIERRLAQAKDRNRHEDSVASHVGGWQESWARSAVAMLFTLSGAVPALAEHTRFWRQSDYDNFERGTAKGVALRSDGKIVLAPKFAPLADPGLAYLWELKA